MNKYWFIALVVVLGLMTIAFEDDRDNQCDGDTKFFASLGRVYPCNNYTGIP